MEHSLQGVQEKKRGIEGELSEAQSGENQDLADHLQMQIRGYEQAIQVITPSLAKNESQFHASAFMATSKAAAALLKNSMEHDLIEKHFSHQVDLTIRQEPEKITIQREGDHLNVTVEMGWEALQKKKRCGKGTSTCIFTLHPLEYPCAPVNQKMVHAIQP